MIKFSQGDKSVLFFLFLQRLMETAQHFWSWCLNAFKFKRVLYVNNAGAVMP